MYLGWEPYDVSKHSNADKYRTNWALPLETLLFAYMRNWARYCFRYAGSIFPLFNKSEISSLKLSSVTVEPGLCPTWSEPRSQVFSCRGSIDMYALRRLGKPPILYRILLYTLFVAEGQRLLKILQLLVFEEPNIKIHRITDTTWYCALWVLIIVYTFLCQSFGWFRQNKKRSVILKFGTAQDQLLQPNISIYWVARAVR